MRINLKIKLISLMLAIIAAATLSLGLISYNTSSQALIRSVNSRLSAISDKVALEIEDMNEKEFAMIRAIAKLPILQDESVPLDEKVSQLKPLVEADKSKYENITYYDRDGNGISAAGVRHSSAHKDYFQAAIKGKEFVCNPFYSDVGKKTLQIYSVPVYTDSRITGVVVAILYGDRITSVARSIDIGDNYHPSIIDRASSTTIANPNDDKNDVSEASLNQNNTYQKILSDINTGASDTTNFKDSKSKSTMLVCYKPIGNTAPWTVLCVVPSTIFYQDIVKIKYGIIVALIVSIVVACILGFILISMLFKPLNTVKKAIVEIGSGNADLTHRLQKASNDEIGDIVDGFNNFSTNLQKIVKNVKASNDMLDSVGAELKETTDNTSTAITQIISTIDSIHAQINTQGNSVSQTAGAVNEIASNIESLDRMIESQSSSVSEASSAVEQMIGNITSVNRSVDKMAESFSRLENSVKEGTSLQANVGDKINQIKNQSETLHEANLAIAAIAEQTNLLAMNAAIEAAHAGEAGKGFSVVADEIRKLSVTSTEQSKTIGDQLNFIRESIENMVEASSLSNKAFSDVASRISETDELVRQIKSSMEEQEVGSHQITDALHSMNDSTLEVRTASQEMSVGNKAILEEIKNLQDSTGAMEDCMKKMETGASTINATGSALNDISKEMQNNILKIGTQINQFTV
ncbi:methyl-accepting chemotaxis protein [Treponema sp.]|uniref:methyl-accepting chemotaxis protein n=1 Tax=Treponema sp. TaxID=166 RepID=UPI00298E96FD|nr:methyl-accepting chemotaxis protein [Treponema sp.]MCQ2242212.1 methyl-accepting chemotaxis protein [Treponema sp.]